MPGILQTFQMLESTKKIMERIAKAVNNPLNLLTPQPIKYDNSRILTDLFSCSRTESSLMQVYMEGAAPALIVQVRNEISMDS